jgi:MFS family permease
MLPFATSAFQQHSLVSTVTVIQGVVSAVIKLPMGKIADVFGRLESFVITILLYTIGYIQQASSANVRSFASAQIFWAAGFNGLQILQQIFVADTTDLLNRALYSTLFDIPFLWTVWASPVLGNRILKDATWRWGYGIWAIILPICFVPLAVSLWMNQKKAKRLGYAFPSSLRGHTIFEVAKNLSIDLDLFGLLLLTTAISLILLPLTVSKQIQAFNVTLAYLRQLAPNADREWDNPSMIAMLVFGALALTVFPFWETNKKLAPKAFFPPNLFKNRTVVAGTLIAFFYFSTLSADMHPVVTNDERSGILYVSLSVLFLLPTHRAK